MDPLKIYDYLTLTRQRVFDAVRPLTSEQYHRPFAIGLKTISRTLTHIMISEWYYIQRLQGLPVPPYAQWPIQDEQPPEFDVLERTWREQAAGTRASIAAESSSGGGGGGGAGGWTRSITWLSFPDDSRGGKRFHITATTGDFLTQLAFHEVHHRAQVMAMLRELAGTPGAGKPLEDLDYNSTMFDRREAT